MTNISTAAAARREAARESTGEFGEHAHSAPEVSLSHSEWPDDLGLTQHAGQWGDVDVEYGARTPWGPAQHPERSADGIVFVPTDGHGGYKLSKERNAAIPPAYRNSSGWYDEDDDRKLVEFHHYDALFARVQDAGRDRDADLKVLDQAIRDSHPLKWEKVNGRTLEPGESFAKDQDSWTTENADSYVVIAQQTVASGALLLTATRASTGDRDTFLLSREARDAAQDSSLGELGSHGRFRVPVGTLPEPRPEPVAPKPAFTSLPTIDGLSKTGQVAVLRDLGKQWRLRASGEVLTLRQQIERGHITAKSVQVTDSGARAFYLENENTSSALQVSKATFEAFEAPDTRSAADHAMEEYRIASAKRDKAQRAIDRSNRPSTDQFRTLRDAKAAADAAWERYERAKK